MSEQKTCYCGTSWSIEIEKLAPEAIAKFHNEQHAKYETAAFERRKQFANAVFDLPENTQWVKGENK